MSAKISIMSYILTFTCLITTKYVLGIAFIKPYEELTKLYAAFTESYKELTKPCAAFTKPHEIFN